MKKYRRVISHDTGKWWKDWGKTDSSFGKWYEEFGTFPPEHSSVKIWILMGSIFPRMSLKFTEKLCVMTMKNVEKTDMTNLVNFNASSGKFENLHFDVLLLSIAYKVSVEKVQKSYISWHWKVIQTLKKNSLFIWKKTWEIWWILTRAMKNLKICNLMRYFCQKYVMFELQ